MSTLDTASRGSLRSRINLAPIQKFGRSLMLPIAALPAAALLLRLGQPDLLGADGVGWERVAAVIGSAGNALFANLPLLFAVGIAIGMAKKADGSTALAAVVGYLVFKGVGDAMSPLVLGLPDEGKTQALINYGVLGGIVMGLVSAFLWQRYYRTSLPPYLAFFGGRRLVPILTAVAAIVISVLMSLVYPVFDSGITAAGEWATENSVIGGFFYGFANRLLIPLGLHHILNNPPWFVFGSFEGSAGVVHGDIPRFLAGDPTAGAFMTGFFPIMMFALPAAAIAIWHEAKPENKKLVGGLMLSAALTAFLTGVTEPLEFAFMFVAFPLYVLHALPDRHLAGPGQRARDQGRVRLLGRTLRLRAQLEHRHQAGPVDPDRARLRSRLLRTVPVRDPQVEPAHARARGRGCSGQQPDVPAGHERLTVLVAASRVVTPTRVLAPGWLRLSGPRIVEVGSGTPPGAPDVSVEGIVAPGFVDMHVHGGGGASFDAGTADAAATVVRAHLAHGTTSMVASLVTDTHDVMTAAIKSSRSWSATACWPASTSRARG